MQKKTYYIFLVVTFVVLSFIITLLLYKFSTTQAVTLLSPVGFGKSAPTPIDDLYTKITRSHTIDNFPPNNFFPENTDAQSGSDLDIDVDSFIALDRDTRKILLAKNITKRFPIASISKIATTIVAMENADLNLLLLVSSTSAHIGEASMGLTSGEKITVEDALYGAMLPSGNDAAETLAEGIGKYHLGTKQEEVDGGGARDWFIRRMNEKVQSLGMMDTYFFNPTGLDESDLKHSNFSTALDLAAFANYALSNPTFAKISDTREVNLPYRDGFHKEFYLYNILSFDESYKGIKGIKPGNSDFAKETLASYIERDDKRIIVIILGSTHTKDDVVKIYDKIFKKS